jgi:hypothetical protein
MDEKINEEFGTKLLEKMKEEKIAPKPRWQFLLKKYVVLASGVLALIIGGLSTSVAVYFLQDSGLNIYQKIDGSPLRLIFLTLPYFWLIFLALFIFVLYYNLKHTDKGYRYSVAAVAAVSIILSLVLGAIFFQLGIGRLIDDVLGERTPLYSSIMNQQINFWDNPEEGRLTGLVVSQISENEFILLDMDRQIWQIVTAPDYFFLPGIIEASRPIRIIGVKIDDQVFQAREVFPVGPGRKYFRRFENDSHFHPLNHGEQRGEMPLGPEFLFPFAP